MAIAGTARRPAAENRETVFVQRGKSGPLIPGPGASRGQQGNATRRKGFRWGGGRRRSAKEGAAPHRSCHGDAWSARKAWQSRSKSTTRILQKCRGRVPPPAPVPTRRATIDHRLLTVNLLSLRAPPVRLRKYHRAVSRARPRWRSDDVLFYESQEPLNRRWIRPRAMSQGTGGSSRGDAAHERGGPQSSESGASGIRQRSRRRAWSRATSSWARASLL